MIKLKKLNLFRKSEKKNKFDEIVEKTFPLIDGILYFMMIAKFIDYINKYKN